MSATIKPTGRPLKDQEKTNIYDCDLYKILQENLPSDYISPDGRINTEKLAESLEFSRYTVYRWFSGKNMSPRAARKLLDISSAAICEKKDSLTREMLLPFCGL